MSRESCNIHRRKANRALDLFPGSARKCMDGLCTLNYAMVKIHAPIKKQSKISLLRDDSKDRLHFKAAFHVSRGLLEKKIYSTENKNSQ